MKKRLLAGLIVALLAVPAVAQVEGSEINELPAVTTPADTDELPTDQVGAAETRKITRAQIVAGVLALLQAHEAATGVHGITAYMETLLDDATAADARTTLELGTAATSNTGDFEAAGAVAAHEADTTSVHGIADTSALLDTGDIGSTVQAQDAELAAVAGLVSAAGKGIEFTGSGTAGLFDLTTAGKALLDDASAAAQLTTLGAAAASHAHAGEDVTSGTVAGARLGLMVGDSGAGGSQGAVSAPAAGDAAANKFWHASGSWQEVIAGIGGSLGSTDDCVVRQNGTGGSTVQCSSVTIDDSGKAANLSSVELAGGTSLEITSTPDANTLRVVNSSTDHYLRVARLFIYSGSTAGARLGFNASSATAGLSLPSNQFVTWTNSTTSSYATIDVGLERASSSVVRVTAGSSGIGSLLSSTLVEANTAGSGAPNVLTATESGTCINNNGATALVYQTLPAAAAGLTYCGCVTDSDGLRFTAVGDDTIRSGGTVTGAAGYMESTQVGDCWELRGQDSSSWYVVSAWPTTASLTLSAP